MNSEYTVEITLTLTAEEAQWLHGVMQNPLWGQSPEIEDRFNAEMRKKFFEATDLRGFRHEIPKETSHH